MCGINLDPWVGPHPPGVRLESTLVFKVRWLYEAQPISNQCMGVGFPGMNQMDHCFPPRVVGVVDVSNNFCSGGGTFSSRCATGPRGWPEGQLSQRAGSMGVGFPHRARQYRSGKPPFSSPRCRSCRYLKLLLMRRWDFILSGCGVSPMSPSQSAISGCGRVSTPCVAVSTLEITVFFPFFWSCSYLWKEFTTRG